MSKYNILINILDKIRKEAPKELSTKYTPSKEDLEKINQARSRAFIHLYLKVSFGILEFQNREYHITDGSYDGGIDGYYVNSENRTVYFIQSKFRTTERNFENKKIELEEVLVMDINRILDGEEKDENGNTYNGKIKQLVRDISKVEDIARYSYKVIILANLDNVPQTKLRYLTGGYSTEVFDYENCYEKLIFPVISGTFYNATDVNIFIDLSNKNAGTKISYTVQTAKTECEITVLFVPTIEVAKVLYKYKNSILKFNPRSYLEFEGQKVNSSIRNTILDLNTNEFALYNNGITMLSNETFINERVGQKNKAQLNVKNPQIINGGQTTFTLSRIYEENLHNNVEEIFRNKEVLLKIITLIEDPDKPVSEEEKSLLIQQISNATNQQTPVINADKFSNDKVQLLLQKLLFDRYGILYERKRGEFADGVMSGYIREDQIIERNQFFRLYFSTNGQINKVTEKRLFMKSNFLEQNLEEIEKLDNFYFGYLFYNSYMNPRKRFGIKEKKLYAQIYAMTKQYKSGSIYDYQKIILHNLPNFIKEWEEFISNFSRTDKRFLSVVIDSETQTARQTFSVQKWIKSVEFEQDIKNKFGK